MKLIQYQNYKTVQGMKALLDELDVYWNKGEHEQRKQRSLRNSEETTKLKQRRDDLMTQMRKSRDTKERYELGRELIAAEIEYQASRGENRREDVLRACEQRKHREWWPS